MKHCPKTSDSPGGKPSGVERSQLWRGLWVLQVGNNGLIFLFFFCLLLSDCCKHVGTPGPDVRPTAPFGNVVGWISQLHFLEHNSDSISILDYSKRETQQNFHLETNHWSQEDWLHCKGHPEQVPSKEKSWWLWSSLCPHNSFSGQGVGLPILAEGQNFPGSLSHTDDQTLHPQGLGTCMGSVPQAWYPAFLFPFYRLFHLRRRNIFLQESS